MEHWKNLSLENLSEIFEGVLYKEKWRSIKGYEGQYAISSFGRVKSLKRKVKHYRGGFLKKKAKMLKQGLDTDGYPQVLLCKDGISHNKKVHQLVACAFIKNVHNKPTVNHKWGKKTDNRSSQLEWFTISEQTAHSYEVLKRDLSPSCFKKGKDHKASKPVKQIDLNGNEIAVFEGTRDAQRKTGINRCTITQVCNRRGYYKTAGGFKWEYI